MDTDQVTASMDCLFRFTMTICAYHDKGGFALSEFVRIMTHGADNNRYCSTEHKASVLQVAKVVGCSVIAIDRARSIRFNCTNWDCPRDDKHHNRFIPRSLGPGFESTLVVLDLSHSSIAGTMPASLGVLHNLHSLRLSHNMLTGNVPPFMFAEMVKLVLLDLGDNCLSGRLPSSLSQLDHCEMLYLQHNRFCDVLHDNFNPTSASSSSSASPDIGPTWPQMSSLMRLNLSGNPLTGTLNLSTIDRILPQLQLCDICGTSIRVDGVLAENASLRWLFGGSDST